MHSVPLEPYAQFTLTLDASWLQQGANVLEVALADRHPALLGVVELREVKLDVRY